MPRTRFPSLVMLVGLVGCGTATGPADTPVTPSTVQVLEQFSAEAVRQGQPELAAVLGEVAKAVRFGVTPVTLPVQVGASAADFTAVVTATTLPALGPMPALTMRLLVAVRGTDANAQLLLVASPADLATLVGMPTGTRPDPLTSAGAVLLEGTRGAQWLGSTGSVRLAPRSSGAACPTAPPAGTCTTGTFDAALNGTFTRNDQSATTSVSFTGILNGATLIP